MMDDKGKLNICNLRGPAIVFALFTLSIAISSNDSNASNKKDSNLYAFGLSDVTKFPSLSKYFAFLKAL